MSVCRMSGLNSRRMVVDCRRVADGASPRRRPRDGAPARRVRRRARCVTWRTDGANTKPMASTSQSSAARTASGVVMPQILMNSRAHRAAPRARATRGACRAAIGQHGARQCGRIGRRHQRAADQRQVVAGRRHARRIGGRRDAALGHARHARSGSADASSSSRPGTTFSVTQVARVHADQQRARCARRASTSACASSMSAQIEGLEQHEHVEFERGVDQLFQLGARQHAQDGEHAARAGQPRPSSTW